MPAIECFVPIVPKAQSRHRSRIAGNGSRAFVQTYKSSEQKSLEQSLKAMLREVLFPKLAEYTTPISGPVALVVDACMPIPKSWSKKKQLDAELRHIRHTSTPDCSNLLKNLEDVGNGSIWVDDSQIYQVSIAKHYSRTPGYQIKLWWDEPQ